MAWNFRQTQRFCVLQSLVCLAAGPEDFTTVFIQDPQD
jgi:hypothetical protein